MSDEFLGDRKKALEEAFFAKQNAKLLERMRAERQKRDAVEALARVSQIQDRAVLEKLVELGLDAETWAALSLVPLVEVAWADGSVEPKERSAILAAAAEQGIEPGSASYHLLESWLDHRAARGLFAAWGAYAVELSSRLGASERATLRSEIVERARRIAATAGGILGIHAISEAEARVISELEKPFA